MFKLRNGFLRCLSFIWHMITYCDPINISREKLCSLLIDCPSRVRFFGFFEKKLIEQVTWHMSSSSWRVTNLSSAPWMSNTGQVSQLWNSSSPSGQSWPFIVFCKTYVGMLNASSFGKIGVLVLINAPLEYNGYLVNMLFFVPSWIEILIEITQKYVASKK